MFGGGGGAGGATELLCQLNDEFHSVDGGAADGAKREGLLDLGSA